MRKPSVRPVTIVGSSISYGVSLPREEALGYQAEMRLGAKDACVDDDSEPGFGPEQEWAVAREVVPATRPRVLVWELWDPAKHYAAFGSFAYDTRDRAVDAAGVPALPHI